MVLRCENIAEKLAVEVSYIHVNMLYIVKMMTVSILDAVILF